MSESSLTLSESTAVVPAADLPLAVPAADLFSTPTGHRLLVDLPGVSQADLHVQIEQGVLTIEATPSTTLPEGYERLYGSTPARRFQRKFQLGEDVDTTEITAVIKTGVLTIQLPTTQAASRRIEVIEDE